MGDQRSGPGPEPALPADSCDQRGRAFSLLYLGVARVINPEFKTFDFESWAEFGAPVRSRRLHSHRHPRHPHPARDRVAALRSHPEDQGAVLAPQHYMRDGNTCQYCGQELPRAELNLDTSCRARRAGAPPGKTSSAAASTATCRRGRARRASGAEAAQAAVAAALDADVPDQRRRVRYREWLPFLGIADASYWNVELED